MKRARGWTLMELLLVIAIIALLVALLLPVLNESRKRARMTTCMSNMRQLASAMVMYRGDYGEYPFSMKRMLSYLKNEDILVCPMEPNPELIMGLFPRGNGISSYYTIGGLGKDLRRDIVEQIERENPGHEVDYYTYLRNEYVYRLLREADPNHGLLACVLHGEYQGYSEVSHVRYEGLVLRTLQDGSVQRAQVYFRRYDTDGDGFRDTGRRETWRLLTDAPCPPEVCHGE